MLITISEKGITEPFFISEKASLTGSMFREDCVKQRLVPFLEEHQANGDFFFWPDLASWHFANETQDLFNNFNSPWIKLRPIERFCGILKAKVYDEGWEAMTFRMLRQRIRKTLIEIYI